jgi:hypothetical protein
LHIKKLRAKCSINVNCCNFFYCHVNGRMLLAFKSTTLMFILYWIFLFIKNNIERRIGQKANGLLRIVCVCLCADRIQCLHIFLKERRKLISFLLMMPKYTIAAWLFIPRIVFLLFCFVSLYLHLSRSLCKFIKAHVDTKHTRIILWWLIL